MWLTKTICSKQYSRCEGLLFSIHSKFRGNRAFGSRTPQKQRTLLPTSVRATPPHSPLASLSLRGISPVHNGHDSRGSSRAWGVAQAPTTSLVGLMLRKAHLCSNTPEQSQEPTQHCPNIWGKAEPIHSSTCILSFPNDCKPTTSNILFQDRNQSSKHYEITLNPMPFCGSFTMVKAKLQLLSPIQRRSRRSPAYSYTVRCVLAVGRRGRKWSWTAKCRKMK